VGSHPGAAKAAAFQPVATLSDSAINVAPSSGVGPIDQCGQLLAAGSDAVGGIDGDTIGAGGPDGLDVLPSGRV